jgi:hypothetical protein
MKLWQEGKITPGDYTDAQLRGAINEANGEALK